jgi:hypothetical protein
MLIVIIALHQLQQNIFKKTNWLREKLLLIKVTLIFILQPFLRGLELHLLRLQGQTRTMELTPRGTPTENEIRI